MRLAVLNRVKIISQIASGSRSNYSYCCFCEAIVTLSVSSPNDPKNTVKEYLIRIQITNPDVSCIEGNIKISYP
ncbi:unnamed protein product [Rhizophagus irregularis]|nr:unnamed protein product [Rhizophagus irregularis]